VAVVIALLFGSALFGSSGLDVAVGQSVEQQVRCHLLVLVAGQVRLCCFHLTEAQCRQLNIIEFLTLSIAAFYSGVIWMVPGGGTASPPYSIISRSNSSGFWEISWKS
jgi:hypothetical protein